MTNGFLARPAPRLPGHGPARFAARWTAAAILHALVVAILVAIPASHRTGTIAEPAVHAPTAAGARERLVYLAPSGRPGGGGGGGGNRQAAPIRRARGVGDDALTLRTIKPVKPRPFDDPTPVPSPELPALVIDARPLASGTFHQVGLPRGGVDFGTSTGPGSGGGVGTGTGTGIGPGRGPGLGPGSGGGTGGGLYRPGGSVTAPRVTHEVKPRYTNDALSTKVQGSVWLELIVRQTGRASDIRVMRSLDPGLDEEAIAAVREWQFEPGRLAGIPVDVQVIVILDFQVR